MWVRLLIISCLIGTNQAGQGSDPDIGLVRLGSDWNYFKGIREPTDPVEAWRELDFDDSEWQTGRSSFGNGWGYEATILSDISTGTYSSLYLRKRFFVRDPESIHWLVFRTHFDSGFVAYLNGEEFLRSDTIPGNPDETVPYDAVAISHDPGLATEFDVSQAVSLLKKGGNILCVQAHNDFIGDFRFSIGPELLGNYNRGPYIQDATTESIKIIWKTPVNTTGSVEYGTTEELGISVVNKEPPGIVHVTQLNELEPDTRYFYRVRNKVGEINAVSPIYSFKTLKHSGPVRFMVFGDSGHGTQAQYKIAEVIRKNDPELVFHTGDTVYPSLTGFRADTRCLSVYHDHMIRIPYFYSIGNHDLNGGDAQFLTTFYTPENPFTHTAHFYSVDHGDVHFSVLLAPFLSQLGTTKVPNFSLFEGGIQNQWLDWDLGQTDKPWKVIIMHHPIQTSGNHRFTDSNFNQIADWYEVRQAVLPLVSKHGVQLILNGHDHVYERFAPVEGVHTVTTGAGGGNLYQFTQRATGSMQFQARYNCLRIEVSGETLELEALSEKGEVFDTMTITRSMSEPPKLITATWNSPRVEASRVDDGFGNIPGQKFDFFGKPIEAVAGKNSNLGRAYVNNDRTHVYIGLKQAMFYSVDSIFLFIEIPTMAGRESMQHVGNDMIDFDDQGVDGLDFLETLDFLDFKPSIGCILGDETMDGTTSNFQRRFSDLNTGQGVFYIQRDLTEVPGTRLQQFNRSPQRIPFPFEENADLIELAIPYASLGNIVPGDRIKIGAITARHEVGDAENPLPTPHIDTGYLGKSLKKNSKTGRWLLEPFTIQLAADPALESLDSDTDSLTDIWEISFGLNPFNKEGDEGGQGDPDKDGADNFEEQFAGTDPTDRNSLLKLHAVMIDANSVRLDWETVPGKRYSLEASSFSNRDFSIISPDQFPITANSDHYSFTDSLDLKLPRLSHRYYRLRVLSSP